MIYRLDCSIRNNLLQLTVPSISSVIPGASILPPALQYFDRSGILTSPKSTLKSPTDSLQLFKCQTSSHKQQ